MRSLIPRLERLEQQEAIYREEQKAARSRCAARQVAMLSPDDLVAWMAWYSYRYRDGPPVDAETEALGEAIVRKWVNAMTPAELALYPYQETS